MTIKTSEKVSFYTHLFGALGSFAGMIYLLLLAPNTAMKAVNLTYGLSTVFLFSASSIYHAYKKQENETGLRRKMDHFAIFVMIAGTYTGIGYYYLEGGWAAGILIAQWSLVFLGAIFKFFWINAPRRLNTAIYIAMGWMAILPIKMLYNAMPLSSLLYLFGGGVAFTIGAIMYSRKKPVLKPGFFGFHELFHIMILIGWLCHYMVVLIGTNVMSARILTTGQL